MCPQVQRGGLTAALPFVVWCIAGYSEEPPPDCVGGETFEFEVQATADQGATGWHSDSLTVNACPNQYPPYTPIDISVRT